MAFSPELNLWELLAPPVPPKRGMRDTGNIPVFDRCK